MSSKGNFLCFIYKFLSDFCLKLLIMVDSFRWLSWLCITFIIEHLYSVCYSVLVLNWIRIELTIWIFFYRLCRRRKNVLISYHVSLPFINLLLSLFYVFKIFLSLVEIKLLFCSIKLVIVIGSCFNSVLSNFWSNYNYSCSLKNKGRYESLKYMRVTFEKFF